MAAGTRWARLDLDYFDNPKARAAGVSGRALHLASICWSARQLTDGRVPRSVVARLLADAEVPRRAVDRLVEVGLWLPNGDGFMIHDYAEHQPTRQTVEHEREVWRERQRRRRHGHGDVTP